MPRNPAAETAGGNNVEEEGAPTPSPSGSGRRSLLLSQQQQRRRLRPTSTPAAFADDTPPPFTMDSVQPADVFRGEPVEASRVVSYLQVDLRDGNTMPLLRSAESARMMQDAQASTHRSWRGVTHHVVHVESATTGAFFKVKESEQGGMNGGGRSERHRGTISAHKDSLAKDLQVSLGQLIVLQWGLSLQTATIFCQALLAGLSLHPLLEMLGGMPSRADLFDAYGPTARASRQLIFILCTLSLTGVLNALAHARLQRKSGERLPPGERTELRLECANYVVCLIATQVSAVGDLIFQNGTEQDLSDSFVNNTITAWYVCVGIRSAMSIIGLALGCKQVYRGTLLRKRQDARYLRLGNHLQLTKEELAHHKGQALEPLDKGALQQLALSLKRGLVQVENCIQLRSRAAGPQPTGQ
jgi:hypothetical protein